MFVSVAVSLALLILIIKLRKDYSLLALCKRIKTADGKNVANVPIIPGKTIFGNNFDIISVTPETVFQFNRENCEKAGRKNYILEFLESAVYNVVRAEEVEGILNSQSIITKGVVYDLLQTFLGTGLLTSTDKKWHSRRKLLTPAFHFTILETFLEVFKEESVKLLSTLRDLINQEISLSKLIPKFTLNNVCETALGVKLDNMKDGDEYRDYIHDVEARYIKRTCNPILYYDWVYRWFGDYSEYRRSLQKVHSFSSKIITQRRKEFNARKSSEINETFTEDRFKSKQRYAMLDTLLAAEADGLITHEGICEEVDTFMFEGYDTTSTCLIFTLMNLAIHEGIQNRCRNEIVEIGPLESLSLLDYNKMKYLECVIKETLRLYPSVPFIARSCSEDTIANDLFLPAGTQISIHIFDIHRDPIHFARPNEFDPDRFLNENDTKSNPFAFVPFSAGARNCIGQKFAMLEMKVLLAHILRNYKLTSVTQVDDIVFGSGLVLRSKNEILVKIELP